ncbi:hypothetical protein [Sulfitobacter sp.]|uniref:hypothetical protein n=1 Tax=Sulfitobacter sp. TaxID=1903071 RepID=UPI003001A103
MTLTIRPAGIPDFPDLTDLLMVSAQSRQAADPDLWRLAPFAWEKTFATIKAAMEAEKPLFRQQWLLVEAGGALVRPA